MNVQQSADVMMFRNLSQFLAQNAAILDKSPTLNEDATDFQNALTQLEALMQSVNTVTEITGQEKAVLRENLAQELIRYLSILHRHALKTNQAVLQKATDIKPSRFKQMTDAEFIAQTNQIAEIIRANQTTLTVALVSTTEQKAILEQIQRFKVVKPQVKLNLTQKAIQNEDISDLIKTIKTKLKKMLDTSIFTVEANYPEFVRAYQLNRQRREPVKSNPKTAPNDLPAI